MAASHPLLAALRRALKLAGDPARALGQQAYMKSAMRYHGVRAPDMRKICREVFDGYDFAPTSARRAAWRRDVLAIWRGAPFREERYAAIELTQVRKARALHLFDVVPMFEEMIVGGAWWDFVDSLASHNLGFILDEDPKSMRRTMLEWSRSDDMWKRRSAILCQLHFGERTDLGLLYRCIEPSLSSEEFFLRKAIGWALRQYAWTDPAEVTRYVEANDARLSPLSKREALKNVAPKSAAGAKESATSSRGAPRRTA